MKFVKTCEAHPEQYDVFDKHNRLIAYIRLRWGYLSVQIPDEMGEHVLSVKLDKSGWQGEFENPAQRRKWLKIIREVLEANE